MVLAKAWVKSDVSGNSWALASPLPAVFRGPALMHTAFVPDPRAPWGPSASRLSSLPVSTAVIPFSLSSHFPHTFTLSSSRENKPTPLLLP